MVYKAYNVIYHKGRAIGKPFVYTKGKDRTSLKYKVSSANARWNKSRASIGGYRVKLIKIVKR